MIAQLIAILRLRRTMHIPANIATVAAAIVLSLALGETSRGQPHNHPNILYIMADDHAAHAISAYGSRINKTPNLDRLASEGLRLENCFCVNSICTPSRAMHPDGQVQPQKRRAGL